MKIRRLKTSLFITALVTICMILIGLSPTTTVHASAAADQAANTYCGGISGASSLADQQRSACHKGFVAGYDGGDKTRTCSAYPDRSGSIFANCEAGFDAGKAAKTKAPADDGKAGAMAMKPKSVACAKYHVAASKKVCEKAYDDQIIAMAKGVGQNAAEAGQADPCPTLTFAGHPASAAVKKDCETYYQKGQNQLGKSPNSKCGGVATYFDFKAICAGYNEKQGGNKNPIIAIALAVVSWITALVGVAVVGGIVFGGFLYLTARDNAGQTQKGITIIVNSVVALIAWTFAYVVINFIVPGGLFH